MLGELERCGLLRSERLRRAMLTVRREDFIPSGYRDHAYEEIPLPLPGERATISCPHSYPLFYEPLGLDEGHRFLEVGVGSGYGTSLAREVVGRDGLVVAIDIDATTLAFARENLERAGYTDVVLVHGDGGLGDPGHARYDRICVTAACPDVPRPLIEQLAVHGRLIAPVIEGTRQRLTLLGKTVDGAWRKSVADVLYVSLQGRYGVGSDPRNELGQQAALGRDHRIQARAVAAEHRRRPAQFVRSDSLRGAFRDARIRSESGSGVPCKGIAQRALEPGAGMQPAWLG